MKSGGPDASHGAMPSPVLLFEHSGRRLDRAVAVVFCLWRALWRASAFVGASEPGQLSLEVGLAQLHAELNFELKTRQNGLTFTQPQRRALVGLLLPLKEGNHLNLPAAEFSLPELARVLLRNISTPEDLAYLGLRHLQTYFDVTLAPETIRSLRQYGQAINNLPVAGNGTFMYPTLLLVVEQERQSILKDSPGAAVLGSNVYCELLAALGFIEPVRRPGLVRVVPGRLDADRMSGTLFGFPTSIPGFDEMFEYGGLRIAAASGHDRTAVIGLGSRVVVVAGAPGSGKSTLTLQFALEVCRKGGVALFIALEQTLQESIYTLESLGLQTSSPLFEVVQDMREAMPLLEHPNGKGLLLFLRLVPDEQALDEAVFDQLVRQRMQWMLNYPLRLLVIDPLNALLEDDALKGRRKRLGALFQQAKRQSINLWLVSERHVQDDGSAPGFEDNIADTVLEFSLDRSHNYQRRAIEVRKSRFQREQPGRHHVLLRPGLGIQILPSSQAVAANSGRLGFQASSGGGRFAIGITGLDRMLGTGTIEPGDLVAFCGPAGSARTLIGIQALLGTDTPGEGGNRSSLFIGDSDKAKMESLVELIGSCVPAGQRGKGISQIDLFPVAAGWIEPGEILNEIRERLKSPRHGPVDRILIADISRWESSMPLVAEDAAFRGALLGLLRKSGATCFVLAMQPQPDRQSTVLTDLIVGNADCVIEFDNYPFRGQLRHFVRARRSRNMKHHRDSFEVVIDDHGVHIEPRGSLLRKDAAGNVRAVPIRVFLHGDTPRHREFNAGMIGAIGTSLSPALQEEQISHYDPDILALSNASGIDELQIFQLDEYELPPASDQDSTRGLLQIDVSPGGIEIDGRLRRMKDRVIRKDGAACIAVPFYCNIGLLAMHDGRFKGRLPDESDKDPWGSLASLCAEWEKDRPEDQIFFSCPLSHPDSIETYNCFFLELLQYYSGIPSGVACELAAWLRPESAGKAASVFRTLCFRSHRFEMLNRKELRERASHGEFFERKYFTSGAQGPVVWRHWYNTLSQMLDEVPYAERHEIRVRPLFGNKTTAGDWYLAIPAYSAAQDVGQQLIRSLTTREKELERLYSGVGLPTRSSFYREDPEHGGGTAGGSFSGLSIQTLGDLVHGGLERSRFVCYPNYSRIISAHLHRILEISSSSTEHAALYPGGEIDQILRDLVSNLAFIQNESVHCERCRKNGS